MADNTAPSFAVTQTGKLLTPIGSLTSFDFGFSMTVQPDGKIIVAGASSNSEAIRDFAMVRFNADGTLDADFGVGGKVVTPVGAGNTDDAAYSLTLQSDGKILLAGVGDTSRTSDTDFALVRYNADGTLDTGFGTGGKVLTTVATGSPNDIGYGATAGTGGTPTGSNPSSGPLPSRNADDVGYSVAVQADGKIVVAGSAYGGDATGYDFAIVRYNVDGTLDTGFGTGGKVFTPIGAGKADDAGTSVLVQGDGKIVVVGYGTSGVTGSDVALVRYNPDGTLDADFGTGGKILTPVGAGASSDQAFSASLQADGKIVVAGFGYGEGTDSDFALLRYNADGTLDQDFGEGGTVLTPVVEGKAGDAGRSVTIQSDGKIVVTGYGTGSGTGSDVALVRYNVDGSLDDSFGIGGKVLTPVGAGTSADAGYSAKVLADGKIVVAGGGTGSGGTDFALLRYNADGTLDTTFGGVNTLGARVAYIENAAGVTLDVDVTLRDAELDALNGGLGDYASASLTLARSGGANAQDVFGFSPFGFTVAGAELKSVAGDTFATVSNTGGSLTITFSGSGVATSALANAVARAITYANSSDTPPASVQIGWTFSDGGETALSATTTTNVAITAVNDAPVLAQPASVRLAETSAAGTLVAQLSATDAEGPASAIRYAITGGNAAGLFAIDATTGAITLAAGKHLDYETAQTHVLTVRATDGALLPGLARTLTVSVADVNEALAVTASASAPGILKAGETVTLTLVTETAVAVTGTPKLTLNNGGTAVYVGLDGAGHPTFTYTVAAGDDRSNLTVTGLDLDGGSLDVADGAFSFAAATQVIGGAADDVITADIDGNGTRDLITADPGSDTVSVRLGDGKGGFGAATGVDVGDEPVGVIAADVNGDRKLDLLAVNRNGSTVSVRLGDGKGGFSGTTEIGIGAGATSLRLADVNTDGKLDLLTVNADDASVSVRLGDGKGVFTGATEVGVGAAPGSLVAEDVNGDGRIDLLVANADDDSVSVRLGTGTGTFERAADVGVGERPAAVAVADVNGDGRLDLLTANTGSATVSVRLGDGAGGFGGATEIDVGASPVSVVTADLDGDGTIDLVTANRDDATVSVRLGDGLGGFGGTTDFAVGDQPTSVTVADVNGDRTLDLLVGNAGSDGVSVLLNTSIVARAFDATSVTAAIPGAATGRAIDTTAPFLKTTPTALAAGIEDKPYAVTRAQLLDGWDDLGGQPLSITGVISTSGTVAHDGRGTWTIRPAKDDTGTVTLTYQVTDGINAVAATRSFTLRATNDAPVAQDDARGLVQRQTLSRNVLTDAAADDVDGDTLSVSAVGFEGSSRRVAATGETTLAGRYGTLSVEADGAYTYAATLAGTLAVGAIGADTFTFTVSDGHGGTDTADLVLRVTGSDRGTASAETFYLTGPSDTAYGLAGNDTYHVDAASDRPVEARDAGTDTVIAAVSYALATGTEIEVLRLDAATGSKALALTGNAFANTLIGNKGANTLDGSAGADILSGGLRNDTYIVDNAGDRVSESAGGGTDTVRASVACTLSANVENLVLTGTRSIAGTGNGLANTITGNAGANILDGGLGSDILTGGAGRDTFVFDTAIGTSNVDRITDFRPVDDTIRLENSIFKALTKTGTLSSAAFKDVTDGAALDADDRILYDHDTGRLSYDADGSGSGKAVLFALLVTHPTLTFQDFSVV